MLVKKLPSWKRTSRNKTLKLRIWISLTISSKFWATATCLVARLFISWLQLFILHNIGPIKCSKVPRRTELFLYRHKQRLVNNLLGLNKFLISLSVWLLLKITAYGCIQLRSGLTCNSMLTEGCKPNTTFRIHFEFLNFSYRENVMISKIFNTFNAVTLRSIKYPYLKKL